MVGVLREEPEPANAISRLIEMARDAGGPDNITVVVADFTGDTVGAEPGESVVA